MVGIGNKHSQGRELTCEKTEQTKVNVSTCQCKLPLDQNTLWFLLDISVNRLCEFILM